MATRTMEAARSRRDRERFAQRLRHSPIHCSRNAAERRGIAQDPCLLAGLQLPEPWHDLSAGQSPAAGTPQAGAHQEPASRTLGSEPRSRHSFTFI